MRPVYFFNPSYDEKNINFYNLGLVSIASHLKRKGIPAYVYMNYLDPTFTKDKDYDLVLPEILKQNPKYIGISCMTTQYEKALDLTKRIKFISPETPVIWGGQHVTAYPDQWDEGIDCRIVSWGEVGAESYYDGLFPDSISPQFIFDQPLDFTTVVNYQPVERSMRGRTVHQASIMTSYGCPYSCRFCYNSIADKKVIFRDLNSVVKEIKQVLSMGADSIAFYDELFFLKNRPQQLMEMLDVKFPWLCLARINSPLGDLKYLRSKGCEEIHFGVESGSQRMIDECIKKKIQVKDVIPVLQKVLNADILPRASFIFGMPGETIDDVTQTVHLIMQLAERFGNKFVINGFFFYPIPGTPMTTEAFKGLSVEDCIDAARYSVHPYKLFEHFKDKKFYDWLPDKQFFAECWYIARVISEICAPYKYYEGYKPQFKEWGLSVSDKTYKRIGADELSRKWLDKVRAY
uniref:Putative vitamin B12-binding domain containing protein n=1 Tax=viral metagenome TaxID=1070528 RepID=A0A6M3J8P1_9ZZZZ